MPSSRHASCCCRKVPLIEASWPGVASMGVVVTVVVEQRRTYACTLPCNLRGSANPIFLHSITGCSTELCVCDFVWREHLQVSDPEFVPPGVGVGDSGFQGLCFKSTDCMQQSLHPTTHNQASGYVSLSEQDVVRHQLGYHQVLVSQKR